MCNYTTIFRNPRVPCRSIADLDISHWREEVTQCRVNGINIALGSSKKISPCTSCTCTKDGVRKSLCSINLFQTRIRIQLSQSSVNLLFLSLLRRSVSLSRSTIVRNSFLNSARRPCAATTYARRSARSLSMHHPGTPFSIRALTSCKRLCRLQIRRIHRRHRFGLSSKVV